MIEVSSSVPQTNFGFFSKLSKRLLTLSGWKIAGQLPEQSKFVLAIAPHTSNWDFFIGIAAMFSLNLRLKFLAKASIFQWPIKRLLTAVGGVAINRNHSHGVVGQIVEEFNQNEQFVLALAPEGTRSKTSQWKTGFLHIAHRAEVSVVPVSFDFRKKVIQFHPAVNISSDIDRELADFKQIFKDVCAKNPQAV